MTAAPTQSGTHRLTRAVPVVYEPSEGRLTVGRAGDFRSDLRPMWLWLTLAGAVERDSGFLVNVSDIDRVLAERFDTHRFAPGTLIELLTTIMGLIRESFKPQRVAGVVIEVSNHLQLGLVSGEREMIQVTTKHEFAASHRLWNPALSAEENEKQFGKCANRHGHGHSYVVEVTVQGTPGRETGRFVTGNEITSVVREAILDRFDHKNLNLDTEEFRELIPTVENMSKVFWELLVGRFGQAELARVAVWESSRTFAEYLGPQAGGHRHSELIA